MADPSQIQQVVVNIANNAAYAMREDGGKLTIGLSSITIGSDSVPDENMKPGRYLKLTIKDIGAGIAAEVKSRMFEPFFTTKEQGQGTGMGLAVVYGIVKSCGGAVEVDSEVGKGSKLTVLLPQADDSSPMEEEKEEASSSPRKEHILFVDDEPAVVEMIKKMLERMGRRVTALTDGSEALKVFMENPNSFDIIITRSDHARHDRSCPRPKSTGGKKGHVHYPLHRVQRNGVAGKGARDRHTRIRDEAYYEERHGAGD